MALFDDILSDNRSGSGMILEKTQRELLTWARSDQPLPVSMLFERMQFLIGQFPHFGLLLHFRDAMREYFSAGIDDPGSLEDFIQRYQKTWANAQTNASRNILQKVDFSDKQVLLHSHSSAIHNLFRMLHESGTKCRVLQTYSSPAGEGTDQAEWISGLGLDVQLVHEDAISRFLKSVDFAIFGSDLLLPDHFLNKTGTFPLSLMLNHYDKPVYVLSERRKEIRSIAPPGNIPVFSEAEKPRSELYPGNRSAIKVINYYFEWVPRSLVNEVFLD